MNLSIFTKLHEERLIGDQSLERIKNAEKSKLFSIHWELRTVLYLGVLLLTGGLGILIYKNIDSIGHQVVLAAIALLCAGCFVYCEKKKLPFSFNKVQSPNTLFDYILLLGCLLLLHSVKQQQTVFIFKYRYGPLNRERSASLFQFLARTTGCLRILKASSASSRRPSKEFMRQLTLYFSFCCLEPSLIYFTLRVPLKKASHGSVIK